jgi:hypothetical protein
MGFLASPAPLAVVVELCAFLQRWLFCFALFAHSLSGAALLRVCPCVGGTRTPPYRSDFNMASGRIFYNNHYDIFIYVVLCNKWYRQVYIRKSVRGAGRRPQLRLATKQEES